MKRRIGLHGFFIFIALLTFLFLSRTLTPHWNKKAIDEFWDPLGIGLVLVGFLFRMAARGCKAEASPDGSRLITNGPYTLLRNPMYFGTFLIGLGINLVLLVWWAFLLFLIIFLSIYIPQLLKEERILSQRFGEGYKNYCQVTPAYLPNPRLLFNFNLRQYFLLRWPWIRKELGSLIAIVTGIMAIEIWEDVRLFGSCVKELRELIFIVIPFTSVAFLLYEKEDISGK